MSASPIDLIDEHHVRHHDGNIPLVIAVPHGGLFRGDGSAGFVERTDPSNSIPYFTTDMDVFTAELAELLGQALVDQLNPPLPPGAARLRVRSPSLVVAGLHRSLCDFNRRADEAYPPEAQATRVCYEHYHGTIARLLDAAVAAHGFALLVDLHGQGHRPVAELGYIVSADSLQRSDDELDRLAATSLQPLHVKTGRPLSELIRGPSSFGALLAARGYFSCPSPLLPSPAVHPVCTIATSVDGLSIVAASSADHLHKRHQRAHCGCKHCTPPTGSHCCCNAEAQCCSRGSFFLGGFTTRHYRSDRVATMQIETPAGPRHQLSTHGVSFAAALASALIAFLDAHAIYPPIAQ